MNMPWQLKSILRQKLLETNKCFYKRRAGSFANKSQPFCRMSLSCCEIAMSPRKLLQLAQKRDNFRQGNALPKKTKVENIFHILHAYFVF